VDDDIEEEGENKDMFFATEIDPDYEKARANQS
jgi:hypothetical protein